MTFSRSLFALLVLFGLLATSCRTNLLPQYMPKVQTATVVVFAHEEPTVAIGGSNGDGPVALMADIAAAGLSAEMHQRLVNALDGGALGVALAETFEEQVVPSFNMTLVDDPEAPHDAQIEITVHEYGLAAASVAYPVRYFFDADVRMVYVPENKLVWELSTSISEPLQAVHVSGSGGAALAGSVITLAALEKLTDEDLAATFDALARDVAAEMVQQMREDAVAD